MQIARVAFFAIFTEIRQFNANKIFFFEWFGIPKNLVKTLYTAMQMVGAVISCQGIFFAVESKFTLCYPVAVSADNCTEIRMSLKILIKIIKTKNNC